MKNHALFLHVISAAALLAALCQAPLPAFADDATQVQNQLQQEMDRFGIRPARAGEETVTGQTAPLDATVVRDKTDNVVFNQADGANGASNPAITIGDPPAASEPAYYYTGPVLGAYFQADRDIELERQFEYESMMAWSGSSRFGDDIGPNYHPAFGFPGEPFGGLPTGSWLHFDRRLTMRSTDGLLLESLQNDTFEQFSQLFAGQFDGEPVEDAFADVRGF